MDINSVDNTSGCSCNGGCNQEESITPKKNLLSGKELRLLELIKTSEEKVTVKFIEEKLGKEYIGALGRLINNKLVEGRKERQQAVNNRYGARMVKYYVVKEVKDE